ncbi:MAG TPA: NmrA/HSCARG family protein [Chitinophagaceae bacterium]|nr:NmrA/HSCARG family protein [Chitinophagaceae bacterium]
MSNRKMILVTGATGAQGGSVAKALLAENKFAVRILTRNAASEKAQQLKAEGAEIATGDFDNKESLMAAMKDCYGVFGVTNFWEHFDREYEQGKNLIDAVRASGIQHFVFSSLEDYNKLSNGTLPVPHYDMKAALQRYTKSLQLPATFVQISFYYENFFSFFPLQYDGNGAFCLSLPQGDTKLAAVSVEDYGGIIASVFNHPVEYIGRTVRAVGADKTCDEYANIIAKETGRNVYFKYMPRNEYAALGFTGAEELANMFEAQRLYVPNRFMDLIESYGLNPKMQSFENWVKKNKARFETAMTINEEAMIA